MDFHAYIPVVNRLDLLWEAVDSVPELHAYMTVVDNSPGSTLTIGEELPCEVYRPPVPLTFTQTQNFFFADANKRGCDFCIWFHSDCTIPEGAIEQLVTRVQELFAAKRKWGVAFCYYDILSAVNLEAVHEIGGYDTNIRAYKSDQDFYHRMRIAGWETVDTGIAVEELKARHVGSQTIGSDRKLKFMNGVIQDLDAAYYRAKWGGEAGHESHAYPFGNRELSWKL